MKQKKSRICRYIFRCVFAVLLVLFLIHIELAGEKYSNSTEKMETVHFIGTFHKTEASKGCPLSKTQYPKADKYRTVILKGHFDQQIPENQILFFYMSGMKAKLYVNGSKIYEFGQKGSFPSMMKNSGNEWAAVRTGGIEVHDVVEFKLKLVYQKNDIEAYQNFLSSMCIGQRYEFMTLQIKKQLLKIFIASLIMLLEILFLGTLQALYAMKIAIPPGSWACGLLMLAGGCCVLIDYQYITLLFVNGIFVNILDYILQALICEFLLYYLKSYLISHVFQIIADCFIGIWSVMCVIYFVLQIRGIADGAEVILWYIPSIMTMLSVVAVFLVLDYRKHSDNRIKGLLHSCLILTIAAVAEELHFFLTRSYWIIILEGGLFIFTIAQMQKILLHIKQNMERAKRSKELENELMQSRITIMLSQIQPHFLYNTLTSIQELCLMSPEKAHRAISWFAQFLRGNMDSLSTTELIPFTKELQHVENYMQLEMVRFESYLQVKYDIQVIDFLVPALFLQPIVENAVHYGISKKEKGGTVLIRTYEREEGFYVTVKDDGVGIQYDRKGNIIYQDQKKQSHLGIENVRRRIEAQCGGTLTIKSQAGQGTEIQIYIPRER